MSFDFKIVTRVWPPLFTSFHKYDSIKRISNAIEPSGQGVFKSNKYQGKRNWETLLVHLSEKKGERLEDEDESKETSAPPLSSFNSPTYSYLYSRNPTSIYLHHLCLHLTNKDRQRGSNCHQSTLSPQGRSIEDLDTESGLMNRRNTYSCLPDTGSEEYHHHLAKFGN
jgi:hypothetical protein